ncbi:MAG: hypothetical protein MK101_05095 [Phycisphaerales bacterium]|nr:hypothetical protein [Phycisphaerales bacterium]
MIRSLILLGALLCCAHGAPAQDGAGFVPAGRQSQVAWVLPVHGPIDAITLRSIERRLAAAEAAGADAVVLELDTPGGDLEATLRILQALRAHPSLRSTAWVRPLAFSAGVIIALGTDEIVTTPGARLGDAAPITPLGPLPEAERAKIESPLLAEVTDAARSHGHDERLAQAFVSVGVELWLVRDAATNEAYILDEAEYLEVFGAPPERVLTNVSSSSTGGAVPPDDATLVPWLGGAVARDVHDIDAEPTLPPSRDRLTKADADRLEPIGQIVDSGRLLTLTSAQARAWGLSAADIPNEAALSAFLGGATLHRAPETWSESFARVFMSWPVRIVLIVLVIIGFVVEMAAPGTGAFALGGTAALLLLIGAPWLAGLSTWWPLLAVLGGMALIAIEVVLVPGTLVVGVAGALLLLAGLVFGVSTPSLSGEYSTTQLTQGLLLVGAGVAVAGVLLWLLAGPLGLGSRVARRLALATPSTTAPTSRRADRTGLTGTALTQMRPSGRVQIGETVIDAICSGRWIEAGTAVRIVRDGMEVEVEPDE